MNITLIGMSNIGKTYWSKKMMSKGFARFSCDDYIEQKLVTELEKMGYSGIEGVAKWMGQPYEQKYKESSKKYLSLEEESIFKAIDFIYIKGDGQAVIDTTGSIIYLNEKLIKKLSQLSLIVYMQESEDLVDQMHELYLQEPKPVIWGNSFEKRADETNLEALKRCYKNLLNDRAKKYKKYAHLTIPYQKIKNNSISIEDFLEVINQTYNYAFLQHKK